MLVTELADDNGAGGYAVAERAAVDLHLELVHHASGEAVGIGPEGDVHGQARHLPVAARGILGLGALGRAAERRLRRIDLGKTRIGDIAEAQGEHIGDMHRALRLDIAEGVGAGVAEIRRIRHRADADAVQNYDYRSFFHYLSPSAAA